jgi:para-nitrobenzyl esterase
MIARHVGALCALVLGLACTAQARSNEESAMMSPASPAAAPVVRTSAGLLEGLSEDALNVFKGIPYATPPVGALRWKPPLPMAAW